MQETSFKQMGSAKDPKVYHKMVKKYKAKAATHYFNEGTKVRSVLDTGLVSGF